MRPSFTVIVPVVCLFLVTAGFPQEGGCATRQGNTQRNTPLVPAESIEAAPPAESQVSSSWFTPSATQTDFFSTTTSSEEPKIKQFYQDLFAQAWQHAPDLNIAQAQKRQKDAERLTAMAKRLAPAVTGELSQVHTVDMDETSGSNSNASSSTSGGQELDGKDYSDWNLSMRLPLYNRATSLRMTGAGLDVEAADNELAIARQELDIQLRDALTKYLLASFRLLNLANSVTLAQEHVGRINRGFELRDQTKLQLLQAQANLHELEARRDLYVQYRDSALLDLLNLSGIPDDDPLIDRLRTLTASEYQTTGCINSLVELKNAYERVSPFVEKASDQELRDNFQGNSLLYKRIDLTYQLALNQAEQYTQDNWPELAIKGEYARKEDTRFSDHDGEGSLALVLSVPLFTGGTLYSNTQTQAMAEQIARVSQNNNLRKTVHLITNHRSLIQSLRKVHATQLAHLEQQQEIVRLSLKSYDIKQTSMQDLLTATNRLIDAKNALMETNASLGTLYRQFAWELGKPFPSPPADRSANTH